MSAHPALGLLLGVWVVACSTQSGVLVWDPLSPDEQRLREERAAIERTPWEGASYGAVAGALAGAALTRDARGAMEGARIGRFAGAGAGEYVADLRTRYAERERLIEAMRADVAATITELDGLIRTMERVSAAQRRELAALRARIQAGVAQREALDRELRRAQENLEEMRAAVRAAAGRRELFAQARGLVVVDGPETDLQPVDAEIAELAGRIDTMTEIVDDLSRTL